MSFQETLAGEGEQITQGWAQIAALEDATWLAKEGEVREALVAKHRLALLQQALARDGSDLAAALDMMAVAPASAQTARPTRATTSGSASTSATSVWKFTMQARSA